MAFDDNGQSSFSFEPLCGEINLALAEIGQFGRVETKRDRRENETFDLDDFSATSLTTVFSTGTSTILTVSAGARARRLWLRRALASAALFLATP